MSILQSYGWNDHFNNLYTRFNNQHLEAGRVVAILAFKYVLITDTGKLHTLLSGALMNNNEPESYPKVGDWVLFKRYDAEGIILEVLPRLNELSRKAPGAATARQVLAVNIDAAFIVQGVDRDFNPMRLQRYIQQVQQCGIQPIVLLNKADLVPDPQEFVRAVEELGYGCPVYLASALDKASQEQWAAAYLQPGKTYILLGSSGVGKSTLLNAWLGYQLQQEGVTSASNSKGRHTTTARNLVQLSNASLVIDAPGMREQYHYQASAADKKRNERQFGKISKQVFAHRKKYKY